MPRKGLAASVLEGTSDIRRLVNTMSSFFHGIERGLLDEVLEHVDRIETACHAKIGAGPTPVPTRTADRSTAVAAGTASPAAAAARRTPRPRKKAD